MPRGFRGAIFDVDGVLVDSPHERAWRDTLRELMETDWSDLRARTGYTPEGFTSDVYRRYVSGKPRMSGARAVMRHFHFPEPEARARVYAERKQRMVVELARRGEFHTFPDALRLVVAVREAGLRLAAASSSKNAGLFLEAVEVAESTLLDVFDADTSGRDLAHGKPHPEIFLTAAAELGLAPRQCVVVEDAVSGIEAARAGGMAALAVARAGDEDLLASAGADLVVTSLDDVDVAALADGRLTRAVRA
jgi:HAD superfamily hydrolase (TIGR01509 family)